MYLLSARVDKGHYSTNALNNWDTESKTTMNSSNRSPTYVPTRFAKSLLKLAEQQHFNINQLLSSAGLDFNPLDASAPEQISAIQYSRLYQQVLTLLQDDSFGMHAGRGITAGAFRMMCYAIIHCDTLNQVIKRLVEFLKVFYDQPLHLKMQKNGDWVTISYPFYQESDDTKAKAGEAYGLALWHRFFSWLIASPIEVHAVQLQSSRPANPAAYQRLFGVPVSFQCATNGITFNSRYLELPLAQDEKSLRDFLRTAPYQMIIEPHQAESSALISRVRRIMGYDLGADFPAFEVVASAMNMSAPTLRRHLRKEGVSYQGLKDQCRKEAATAYLGRPELSVNAVAALMGFTDPSAFHRSFKKWTGKTPGQFRRELFAIKQTETH